MAEHPVPEEPGPEAKLESRLPRVGSEHGTAPGAGRGPGRPFASRSGAADDDHHWLVNWQRSEIASLTRSVQELERRLRRRTVTLGGVALLGVVAAGALALTTDASYQRLLSAATDEAAPSVEMPIAPPPTATRRAEPATAGAEPAPSPAPAAGPSSVERSPARQLEQRASAALDQLTGSPAAREPVAGSLQAVPGAGAAIASTPGTSRAAPDAGQERETLDAGASAGRAIGGRTSESTEHYAATVGVDLRAMPNAASDPLTVVAEGEVVRRLDDEGGWLKVSYSGGNARDIVGWIRSDHLRPLEAPAGANGPAIGR